MRLDATTDGIRIHTPAKVNLFLEVLGKRADGYHELETVMLSIGLYDTLRFSLPTIDDGNIRLRLDKPKAGRLAKLDLGSIPTDGSNLVMRAAELLRATSGYQGGATMRLTKRIPAAAGLGGGSSDAAATLVGLNRLWGLRLPAEKLHELAAQLGSDVNFFLDSHPLAICRGRGEQIEPIPLHRRWHLVIARPDSGLSTADVFRRWIRSSELRSGLEFLEKIRKGHLGEIGRALHNSLQPPAAALNPEVAEILEDLRGEWTVGSLMSGSGSACFALCHNRAQAVTVAAKMRARLAVRIDVVESAV